MKTLLDPPARSVTRAGARRLQPTDATAELQADVDPPPPPPITPVNRSPKVRLASPPQRDPI